MSKDFIKEVKVYFTEILFSVYISTRLDIVGGF